MSGPLPADNFASLRRAHESHAAQPMNRVERELFATRAYYDLPALFAELQSLRQQLADRDKRIGELEKSTEAIARDLKHADVEWSNLTSRLDAAQSKLAESEAGAAAMRRWIEKYGPKKHDCLCLSRKPCGCGFDSKDAALTSVAGRDFLERHRKLEAVAEAVGQCKKMACPKCGAIGVLPRSIESALAALVAAKGKGETS